VPDEIPDPVAAMANCATATAAALLRAGGFLPGRRVAILGAGVLGVTAAAMARAGGAREVSVADPSAERRARAAEFGATHTDESIGPGADLVLECAGTAESVAAALALPRVGGTVILAGTVRPTPPVPLDPERVVRRLLTIRGVHNYAPADLEVAVAFLAGPGRAFPFAGLVGRTFALDEVEEAFAHAHAHPGSRVAVAP
jgi:threonine dehydrogenase-like Zn-dependent dehydrogenase